MQREVDKMHPGKFRFDLRKDPGVTGRLEINISSVVNPAEKRQTHSKLKGEGYPEQNWIGFHSRLEKAMEELNMIEWFSSDWSDSVSTKNLNQHTLLHCERDKEMIDIA